MKKTAVSFTGHRYVSEPEKINERLIKTLQSLIADGAAEFYTGGATGFDTLAAKAIINLRKSYPQIHLHLVLPCRKKEQTAKWTAAEIADYDTVIAAADSVEYVSEVYYSGCMKARNLRLAELADCCVCYYRENRYASGTGQTVRIAQKKSIPIINLA